MFDIKKFGAFISKLRKGEDMTQSELAEYVNNDAVLKMLENATFDTIDERLLERLIPFLDAKSISVIFQKILEGELNYKLLKIMLQYADYIYPQIEVAVLHGVLSGDALKILREHEAQIIKWEEEE